jgi:hypothetical protein
MILTSMHLLVSTPVKISEGLNLTEYISFDTHVVLYFCSFRYGALVPDGRIQGRWTQKWISKISCGLESGPTPNFLIAA